MTGPGAEHAEARDADLLNLHAHQLVVHLLGQRTPLGMDTWETGAGDVLANVEAARAADTFARALGVIASLLDLDAAAVVVAHARLAIPALLLRAEDSR